MNKTIITSILIVLMSMIGVNVSAHDIEVKNAGKIIYYNWTNNKTELAVAKYPVSDYAYYSYKYMGDVVIPETVEYESKTYKVTSIDKEAFVDCDGLTSITIGNNVTSIGSKAFYNCKNLYSLSIPNSVTSIGKDAFYGTGWYYSQNIQMDVILYLDNWLVGYYKNFIEPQGDYVIAEGTKGIADKALSGCSGITSITIPNSVSYIGDGVFNETGWYNNQSEGLIYLDNWLLGYKGNKPTGDLSILEGTKGIAENAFLDCSGLTSVTIPNSVGFIGRFSFQNCNGLTSLTINIKEIGSWFKSIETIKDITIGNEVTIIGDDAFSGCSGLTSVTIPNSVTSICDDAFSGCI